MSGGPARVPVASSAPVRSLRAPRRGRTTFMPLRGVVRVAVVAALVALACAPADVAPTARGVIGGDPAADEAVVAVVARRIRCDDTPPALLCSGVLVAPSVVLTAAHCTEAFGARPAYEVFFGARIDEPGAFGLVTEVAPHPEWDPDTRRHDLALLRLAEPAPVAPVPVVDGVAMELVASVPVRAVGYGVTIDDRADTQGERRQGAMRVDLVEAETFRAVPDPALTCVGDSGGPVFLATDAGERLVGITIGGDRACADHATQARVDVGLRALVDAFLAAGPPASSSTDLDALCAAGCQTAADCPPTLDCVISNPGGPGRCELPGLGDGRWGDACAGDGDCAQGATCARLSPSGDAACRCHVPCTARPGDSPADGGCAVAPADPTRRGSPVAALALAGATAAWLARRARARSGRAAGRAA